MERCSEDSSHYYRHTLAVLNFFHDKLQAGEFIVIEDGIISDLGVATQFDGGPSRAVREFFSVHAQEYVLADQICDFFGANVTWNPNGYWQRR